MILLEMVFYGYQKCSTCRQAQQFLRELGWEVPMIPIRETPPSVCELRAALVLLGGDVKSLLNTAGAEFRAMGLKEKPSSMSEEEIFALVQEQGNLCKRPFLLDEEKGIALTGFRREEWQKLL
jgi:arsenate reductase